MDTQLLKPTKEAINLAVKLIKQGEVVGVPTETVYGLAGDSSNPQAIKKIFEAKGRPMDNPLICHISNMKMLKRVAKDVPEDAKKLAEAFWPGPLTIILPRGKGVCAQSCAGLDSVGVRIPSNKIAREIIEKSNTPFSAPSANISGLPSPTNAQSVYQDMQGKIPLIIDGGECDAGVESTVVSVLGDSPVILRPGIITKEDMEKVLNKEVQIARGVSQEIKVDEKVLSPGMKYKHYSPKAEVTILDGDIDKFIEYVKNNYTPNTFAFCFIEELPLMPIPAISYGSIKDDKSQAHYLFNSLRKLDDLNAKKVYARCPKKTGVGLAVYNRLIRASGFKVIKL